MITLTFHRRSVSMGDDAMNGKYTIEMPDASTLGDLIHVIQHGGNGNDWPIPYSGANSFWLIQSNIGNLADIYTDQTGEWHIRYFAYTEETPLQSLGITWTFGENDIKSMGKRPAHDGYTEAYMTGKEIKEYLSDACNRLGTNHEPVAGPNIMIHKYKKIQDDKQYRVFYNDSFFKIVNAETNLDVYYLTYIKAKPKWPKE